jgi:alpha-glucuronidase
MQKVNFVIVLLVFVLFQPWRCAALGDAAYVHHVVEKGDFQLVNGKKSALIVIDSVEYWGVKRAAHDLQQDVQRVTGNLPLLVHSCKTTEKEVVLIGTIGKSNLIDHLIATHKLRTDSVVGKWEAFTLQVVDHPMPGVDRALVIAGSDKRGTIYGIYDLSEQIGVSPW